MRPVTAASWCLMLAVWALDNLTSPASAQGAGAVSAAKILAPIIWNNPWEELLKKIFEDINNEFRCKGDEFACTPAGPCIPYSWTCDTMNDCLKGEDEIFMYPEIGSKLMGKPGAGASWKKARGDAKGKNVPKQEDSGDFLVNAGLACGLISSDNKCDHPHQFMCIRNNRTTCIPMRWTCDGFPDCDDGVDEVGRNASSTTKTQFEFHCPINATRPVPKTEFIDDDDPDKKITIDIPAAKALPRCDGNNTFDCSPKNSGGKKTEGGRNRYIYNTSACIPKTWTCDGYKDCTNGADEDENIAGCSKARMEKCLGHNQFQCRFNTDEDEDGKPSPICIASALRCNIIDDCGDLSDEANCPYCYHKNSTNWYAIVNFVFDNGTEVNLGFEGFECSNKSKGCITTLWTCDTVNDCGNETYSEDEAYCDEWYGANNKSAWPNAFHCNNSKFISRTKQCNYDNDCGDWSDEDDCVCEVDKDCPFQPPSMFCNKTSGFCDCNPAFLRQENGRTVCLHSAAGSRAEVIHGSAPLVMLMALLALIVLDAVRPDAKMPNAKTPMPRY